MGYIFGTGIIGAITAGLSLLRGSREEQWTWRTALAWLSWGITLALAIGSISDLYRERRGKSSSRGAAMQQEALDQHKRTQKQLRKSGV